MILTFFSTVWILSIIASAASSPEGYDYVRNGVVSYNILDGAFSDEGQGPRIVYENGTVSGPFADYINQIQPYNYSVLAFQELLDWVEEDEVEDDGILIKPGMRSMAEGEWGGGGAEEWRGASTYILCTGTTGTPQGGLQ